MSIAQEYRPASTSSARETWADQARGLGIFLVVLGHVWRGLYEASIIPHRHTFEVVDRLIYSFHMPLFFVLAGLFFERVLLQKPVKVFIWSRVVRLIYPLVLWTYIFAFFKASVGSLANSPVNWENVLELPLPPKWHFWFLWALFLIQICALGLKPLLIKSRSHSHIWLATLVLTVLMCLDPLGAFTWAPLLAGALYNAPFFVLGVLISRHGLPLYGLSGVAAAILTFVAMEWLALSQPETSILRIIVGSMASVAVCILIFEFSHLPGFGAIKDAFGSLGRASMAIYLSHTIFSAATRVALQQAGITNVPFHIAAGLVLGLLGPILLLLAAQRTGSVRLFGF